LEFGVPLGSSFQRPYERQQLSQFVLDQFLAEQRLLPTLVLKSLLVAFTIFFSASIHVASPIAPYRSSMTAL
jgi:hypothetical protein